MLKRAHQSNGVRLRGVPILGRTLLVAEAGRYSYASRQPAVPEEIAQFLGKSGPSQSVCRAPLVPGRMVPVEDLVNAGVASRSSQLKSDQLAR